jgi:hypothetical protein
LNIGFISIKLLPSQKQSLLLLEWGYIRLILLNGDPTDIIIQLLSFLTLHF